MIPGPRPEWHIVADAARPASAGGQGLRRAPTLAWQMARRDFRARYRTARFGVTLAIAPAAGIVAWAILAGSSRVVALGDAAGSYPLFVTVGIVLWQAFTDGLTLQVDGLRAERPTLLHHALPPEGLALAKMLDAYASAAIKMVLVGLVAVWAGPGIGPWILFLPAAAVAAIVAGAALGLWIAPLALLFRDIALGLTAGITACFFVTPVLIPVPADGALRTVFLLNPLTPILEAGRATVMGGSGPDITRAAIAAAFWLVVLVLGWRFHRVAVPRVVERQDS